jgi:hypothetical protein
MPRSAAYARYAWDKTTCWISRNKEDNREEDADGLVRGMDCGSVLVPQKPRGLSRRGLEGSRPTQGRRQDFSTTSNNSTPTHPQPCRNPADPAPRPVSASSELLSWSLVAWLCLARGRSLPMLFFPPFPHTQLTARSSPFPCSCRTSLCHREDGRRRQVVAQGLLQVVSLPALSFSPSLAFFLALRIRSAKARHP